MWLHLLLYNMYYIILYIIYLDYIKLGLRARVRVCVFLSYFRGNNHHFFFPGNTCCSELFFILSLSKLSRKIALILQIFSCVNLLTLRCGLFSGVGSSPTVDKKWTHYDQVLPVIPELDVRMCVCVCYE